MILQKLASICDPLGFISATTVIGKVIYRDTCESNVVWDVEMQEWIKTKRRKCERRLPAKIEVPKSINLKQQKVDIYIFGDARLIGTRAVAHTIVSECSSTKQLLLTSKSRLSKKGLAIRRLELIAAQMIANLAESIKSTIPNHKIETIYGWSDSLVILHWLQGHSNYRQNPSNHIKRTNSMELCKFKLESS